MSSANQDATRDRIEAELDDPLRVLGLDIEAVEITPAGKRRILKVAVDKDGGVTLDEVAEATREVNRVLDGSEVMGERPYTLEVSSPGVGRPLTGYAALRRNVGRLVTLTVADQAPVTGRILSVTPDEVTVRTPATRKQPSSRQSLPLAKVRSGTVQVEFSRPDGSEEPAGEGH